MAIKAATRYSLKTDASVFKRLGRRNQENIATSQQVYSQVCKYWLKGKCTRNPCKFLHPNQAKPETFKSGNVWRNPASYQSQHSPPKPKFIRNKENCDQNQIVPKADQSIVNVVESKPKSMKRKESCEQNQNVLKMEKSEVFVGQTKSMVASETVVKDEKCHNLKSQYGVSMVAKLEGHSKAVTGIVFPSSSSHLYSSSKDKTLRVWDCNSGQCQDVVNFDGECGTLVEEDPWYFVGLKDMIKAWNHETQTAVIIRASGGMVNAITMYEDVLFAGMEDGTILSWKCTSKTSFSEEATSLKGHTGSVLSLIVGAKQLFSGSTDHTIRVWNPESLQCKQVLNGHTSDVTSLVCWDKFLLSGSLDKTIKVWGATESGNIEEVFKHDVDDGVLAFCGMYDAEEKPMLLCSCKDSGVCLYDLPSFTKRGRIFSEHDIKAIKACPMGLFFTGDAAGSVSVWKPIGSVS